MNNDILDRICEKIEKNLEQIDKDGIRQTNIDYLYKLVDVKKDITEINKNIAKMEKLKEEYNMMYRAGGYGNNYGDNYGRRGRDSRGRFTEGSLGRRYRGHDYIDDMADAYGAYEGYREGGYGGQEMNNALDYMLKSVEELMKMLKDDASSKEEVEKIRRTARRIAEM